MALRDCDNRRSNRRVAICCDVLLKTQPGRALNLSPDGARILVSREVELRRPTTLTLMGDDGESFSFQAVPVWQKRVSPVARVVGLQFLPEQVEAYSYRWWLAKSA